MSFDNIIVEIGEFGRFQRVAIVLLWLISISFSMHIMAMVFIGVTPAYHCAPPRDVLRAASERNLSQDLLLNLTMPWERDVPAGTWRRAQCTVFMWNFTSVLSTSDNTSFNLEAPLETVNASVVGTVPCETWSYSKTYHSSSIVTEWNLVCGRTWMNATGQSTFMLGLLLGCFLFGYLSDRFGRRCIIIVCTVIQVSFGTAVAFSPNYIIFIILRFVVAMATAGQKNSSYIMIMELTGPSWRGMAGMLSEFFWSAGYLLLGVLSRAIPDWRVLQLVISAPAVVFLSYQWILPESPRWLLSVNKKTAAERVLKKIAKWNRKEWSMKETKCETVSSSSGSVIDLVRTKNIRNTSFALWFIWFVGSLGFFGLSFHAATLGGDIFVNYWISGLVELPSYASAIFAARKCGRRLPLGIGMTVGGLACLSTALVPSTMKALLVTLAVIGKFGMCVFFAIIYMFTAELYPTGVRNVGLGIGSVFARIGGIVAPYIAFLNVYYSGLPLIVYGAMSVAAGLLSFLLPETLHRPLPDSVKEAELLGGLSLNCKRTKKQPNLERDRGQYRGQHHKCSQQEADDVNVLKSKEHALLERQ